MNEYLSNHEQNEAKEQNKREYISLAKELSDRTEGFPFPGVTAEAYIDLKAVGEEYPEYTTPIDELMEKYRTQGIKVVIGKSPESGNVFILPRDSDDIEMDNISPRQLELYDDMDDDLIRLITLNIELNNS